MSRADLLALGPEAVAALANLGLVKRALREIEAGAGPALAEEADGTVIGTFADGAVARLPPGKTLRDAPCTCGAAGICRHRVAAALAYKAFHAASAGPAAAATEAWSPAEIGDEPLALALGDKRLARARALAQRGLLVDVSHAAPPTARLPSCTVRFLVPRDVAYARCDCAEPGGCEHLALAVWAFRAARGDGPVSLGARVAAELGPVDDALALVRDLLASGVTHAAAAPARFAQARAGARAAGMVWIESLIEELEQQLDAYRARSAAYAASRVASLSVELAARARAARGQGELPARFVLGEDEAPETQLDHVRLVSLGARVRADGPSRRAQVFLADPDTATVLVLDKRWELAAGEEGAPLARRAAFPRVPLGLLAAGQVVSKAVRRRANRSVELATSRAGVTSVTPQRGEWAALPGPLLVRDLEAHGALLRARPPAFLRPRVLAENVHAVAISEVLDLAYLTAEQSVVALLADEAGHQLRATVAHRAAAPQAVDAAARAFSGPVRFVSGELARGRAGWELDVLGVAGEALVVPDLATEAGGPGLPPVNLRAPSDPVREALASAAALLEELVHAGLRGSDVARSQRTAAAARRLDDAGLRGLALRLDALDAALARGDAAGAADAWLDAGVRAALMAEML